METRWEDGIFGRVARQDWIDVGATVPTRQSDPIDGLFGDEKTDNITAYWESIASEYGIPVMAQFHAFDVEAQKTLRIPIDNHNIEKGLIKVKINQSERLRALQKTGVVDNDRLYDYVLQDGINLADQVITRTKVAKNELMATGKITIKENGLDLTVDYGVPDDQTSLTIDITQDADVAAQLQAVVDAATDKGVIINGMQCPRKILTKLRNNKFLQTAINGNIGAGTLLRQNQLEAYLSDEFGIDNIVTNDLKYGSAYSVDENGRPHPVQHRYYPENKITFFATNPNGRLGVGLWGDSPDADLTQYQTGGSTVSPYVTITQKQEWDPAVLWTKASALFIPVLYNPNSLWIATTTEV